MLRYSLRTMAVAVALIAIFCVLLLKANPWVASTSWTLLFMVLSLAAIAATLLPAHRRGFWTGFALAGWLYAIVGIGPLAAYPNGHLLTTATLHRAAVALPQPGPAEPPGPAGLNSAITSDVDFIVQLANQPQVPLSSVWQKTLLLNQGGLPVTEYVQSFIHVGQSLWTLLLALLGGWFGAFIAARCHRLTVESNTHGPIG
jgi:hypothetical protein